jgi:hypothetical protein
MTKKQQVTDHQKNTGDILIAEAQGSMVKN